MPLTAQKQAPVVMECVVAKPAVITPQSRHPKAMTHTRLQ